MTIATSPASPVTGELVTLTPTITGNVYAIELTATPSTSSLSLGLLLKPREAGSATVVSATVAIEAELTDNTITFDEPGAYTFTVYDYRQIAGSPQFPGDPAGVERVELIAAVTGELVDVGELMALPIVTELGNGGELRVQVTGTLVTAASIVDTLNERSRLAALQPAVAAAVAALVGLPAATMGTDLIDGVNELLATYQSHRVQLLSGAGGIVHRSADTTNQLDRTGVSTTSAAIDLCNELRAAILGHLRNSTSLTLWHVDDDYRNELMVGSAHTLAQATTLLADMRLRMYERHRLQDLTSSPTVHDAADDINPLVTPASPLDDAIVAYLDAILNESTTAPANEPQGVTDLAQKFGFVPKV